MKKTGLLICGLAISGAVAAEGEIVPRTAPWQPSSVLIKVLDLKPDPCADSNAVAAETKKAVSEKAPTKPPPTEAEIALQIQAASKTTEALLAARKIEMPEEYDAVWLDYQTALALSAAQIKPELVDKLINLVLQPYSRLHEEQLLASWMREGGGPVTSYDLPNEDICQRKTTGLSPAFLPKDRNLLPEDLGKHGIPGEVQVKIELRPDQSEGRMWIHSSSHSGYEKAALHIAKFQAPRFCSPHAGGRFGIATTTISFAVNGAKQKPIIDPIYDFRGVAAYRAIAGEPDCKQAVEQNPR